MEKMESEKVPDPLGSLPEVVVDGAQKHPRDIDVEKCAKGTSGEDIAIKPTEEKEKMRPRYFDGTATLTVGDGVILIPTPSADPRGTSITY